MAPYITVDHIEYIFEQFAIFALALLMMYIVLVLPLVLLAYIFSSAAYTRMAKRLCIKGRLLAWIPFARSWIMGAIADKLDSRKSGSKHMRVYLLCASLSRILGWALGLMILVIGIINTFSILGLDTGIWGELSGFNTIGDPTIILPLFFFYLLISLLYVLFFTLAFIGLRIITIHKIFETLRPRICLLHSTLGLLIPLYRSICLLSFSKSLPEEKNTTLPEAPSTSWYDQ